MNKLNTNAIPFEMFKLYDYNFVCDIFAFHLSTPPRSPNRVTAPLSPAKWHTRCFRKIKKKTKQSYLIEINDLQMCNRVN